MVRRVKEQDTLEEAKAEIERLKAIIEDLKAQLTAPVEQGPEGEVAPEAPTAEEPIEEPVMEEPVVAPAVTIEPAVTPEGEPVVQITPAERYKIRVLEQKVAMLQNAVRAKSRGIVRQTTPTERLVREGNREILHLDNGKRFITERSRAGVSFWMED